MKKITFLFSVFVATNAFNPIYSQVQMDHSIQLSGTGTDAKIEGIKDVSSPEDAVNAKSVQNSSLTYAGATGSQNAFEITLVPDPTPLVQGAIFHFVANNAVSGAATLDVNGSGSVSIMKNYDEALTSGDIKAGQAVSVMYDGTNFQVISQLSQSSGGSSATLSFDDTKRIFVTSTSYNGNLGGLSGADSKCQARADAASLGGTWKALLSTSANARDRSNHLKLIVNMKNEAVAMGYKDLFMSQANLDNNITVILNTVAYNEFGVGVFSNWWNGSDESGRGGMSNCNDWTTGSGSSGGHMGETYRVISTSFWGGNGNNSNCDSSRPIICFEE